LCGRHRCGRCRRPASECVADLYPAALSDSFYTSPADLTDHRPGDVLAAQPAPDLLAVLLTPSKQ
ncbi:MAG: hypothetical protein WBD41_29940, partial [Rhodococcus sp. (in: high G+C Gram-positive bacteria)]